MFAIPLKFCTPSRKRAPLASNLPAPLLPPCTTQPCELLPDIPRCDTIGHAHLVCAPARPALHFSFCCAEWQVLLLVGAARADSDKDAADGCETVSRVGWEQAMAFGLELGSLGGVPAASNAGNGQNPQVSHIPAAVAAQMVIQPVSFSCSAHALYVFRHAWRLGHDPAARRPEYALKTHRFSLV